MIPSESEYQFNVNGTTSLTAAEFNKKVKSNVPFLLYLGKEGCAWCRIFSPVIKQYEDQTTLKPTIYYLDLHQLELHQDNPDVQAAVSHLKDLTIVATPTIAVVHGQNVVAGFAGAKHTINELNKVASAVYNYDNYKIK